MAIPIKKDEAPAASTIEDVLIRGDLSALTPQQRTEYYLRTCRSLGLNPMTQPFAYITLNGKLVLYALRACADQLRKINGISLEIVSQDLSSGGGLLSVHVRAKDKTGRTDEDLGVVAVGQLKGEAAANAILKAVTKAKRRVTLSISGLGYLDETEIEDIPAASKREPAPPIEEVTAQQHDTETGEVRGPHELKLGDSPDWRWYGAAMVASLEAAKTDEEFDQWIAANYINTERMRGEAPRMQAFLEKRVAEIAAKGNVK